jgi:hypothetical protein
MRSSERSADVEPVAILGVDDAESGVEEDV